MVIVSDEGGNGDYVGYLNFSTNQAVRFKKPSTARMFTKSAAPCVLTIVLASIAGGVGWFMTGFITGIVAFAVGLWPSWLSYPLRIFACSQPQRRGCVPGFVGPPVRQAQ